MELSSLRRMLHPRRRSRYVLPCVLGLRRLGLRPEASPDHEWYRAGECSDTRVDAVRCGCKKQELGSVSRTSGGACALSTRALGPVHFGVAVPPSSCFILCPAEATESVTWSGAESALMAVDRTMATPLGCS